jgi:hypothetical protein
VLQFIFNPGVPFLTNCEASQCSIGSKHEDNSCDCYGTVLEETYQFLENGKGFTVLSFFFFFIGIIVTMIAVNSRGTIYHSYLTVNCGERLNLSCSNEKFCIVINYLFYLFIFFFSYFFKCNITSEYGCALVVKEKTSVFGIVFMIIFIIMVVLYFIVPAVITVFFFLCCLYCFNV